MKVEVVVLGFPSLLSLMVFVDKAALKKKRRRKKGGILDLHKRSRPRSLFQTANESATNRELISARKTSHNQQPRSESPTVTLT